MRTCPHPHSSSILAYNIASFLVTHIFLSNELDATVGLWPQEGHSVEDANSINLRHDKKLFSSLFLSSKCLGDKKFKPLLSPFLQVQSGESMGGPYVLHVMKNASFELLYHTAVAAAAAGLRFVPILLPPPKCV